jgi:Methylamine utilisation protein MauE
VRLVSDAWGADWHFANYSAVRRHAMDLTWSHLAIFARGTLAAVFAWAAVSKVRDPQRFVSELRGFRLIDQRLVVPIAWTTMLTEAFISIALVVWRPLGALAAASLLLVYSLVLTVTLRRGITDVTCGCFGRSKNAPIGWHLVIRNWFLFALTVIAAVPISAEADVRSLIMAALVWGLYVSLSMICVEAIRLNHTITKRLTRSH